MHLVTPADYACIWLVQREILWLGGLSAKLPHFSVKTLLILDVC